MVITDEERRRCEELDRRELRDRFAAAALTGIIAAISNAYGYETNIEERVTCAYKYADAAIKEREK